MAKYRKSMEKGQTKAPLWLPYLSGIEPMGKDRFKFTYNGGEVIESIQNITSIMIYGDYGGLDAAVLEAICSKGVPIIIHRRNIAKPIYIVSPFKSDLKDTFSSQLLVRSNERRRRHISRMILKSKFQTMRWLVPIPSKKLTTSLTVDQMRQIEAVHGKAYWLEFYKRLGYSDSRRRGRGQIAAGLNAMSKFLSGILLRWITYHNLSPFHGYLHVQTDYPALVYDLIEPYRAYYDQCALETFASFDDPDTNPLVVGTLINRIKEHLNEEVYTGLTRQIVTRHELFHGIILSLKNYIMDNQRTFMVPLIDKPNGGRPKKVVFCLYGRKAGRTDFWKRARQISQQLE
jgi:CRISPR/Cas system-associated endonuclease Cas1